MSTETLAVAVISLVVQVTCFLWGYWLGHGKGVEETEVRWSEAVERAEARRQNAAPSPSTFL